MIGLDTNMITRLFASDGGVQEGIVRELILEHGEDNCYISLIVLLEFVWVLQSSYKFKKEQIFICLQKIVYVSEFILEERQVVINALDLFILGKADFSDYLLGLRNKNAGCDTTYSFDKKTYPTPDLFRSPIH